ncbi:MAG: glycosyltransferase family 39 protein, partial [Anaerolineae bacterium]|nr:glycosyltransferase family 39 protein [Anaerolineae bacterium]
FLYTLSPNILAHARLSTTDLGMALATFLATYAVWRYVQRPSWGRLLFVGVASGLAIVSKHSALILPIALPGIAFVLVLIERGVKALPRAIGTALLIGMTMGTGAIIAILAFYGTNARIIPEVAPSYDRWVRADTALREALGSDTALANHVDAILNKRALPAPYYIWGILANVVQHDTQGHPTYLHGHIGTQGWLAYFPIAIAIKTPIPSLVLILGSLLILIATPIRSAWNHWSSQDIFWTWSAVAAWFLVGLSFLSVMMRSRFQIGLRHILMIYPCLFAIAGVGASIAWRNKRRWGRVLIILLMVWYTAENVLIYPHYLEYFNEFIGGPANGYKWLVDSNLDWDQDKTDVRRYAAQRGITLKLNPGCKPTTGWIAVNAKHLVGMLDQNPSCYAWTRGHLVDRIHYTWFIFHIPESKEAPGSG